MRYERYLKKTDHLIQGLKYLTICHQWSVSFEKALHKLDFFNHKLKLNFFFKRYRLSDSDERPKMNLNACNWQPVEVGDYLDERLKVNLNACNWQPVEVGDYLNERPKMNLNACNRKHFRAGGYL